MATAGALLLAVIVVAYAVSQIGNFGRPPSPAALPATPKVQEPTANTQPTPMPALKPGQGPLRVTTRVVVPSYTVTQGDTLGSIATRHGTTIEAIQSINNLADRNVLSVGQKLVIPNQD